MSKITRKSYKRKKIILGVSLFGGIGLVSTGFAAWVLSSSTTESKSSSLSVGLVSDKNMSFSNVNIHKTGANDDPVYHFEPAKDDNTGRVRYDGENYESLSLTVDGTLSQVQNLGTIKAIITVEGNAADTSADHRYPARTATEAKAALDEAITKKYVVAPTAYKTSETLLWDEDYTEAAKANYDNFVATIAGENDKTMTFSYEVAFAWGEAFEGDNPSIYFDGNGASVPQGTGADTYADGTVGGILNDLHSLLDGIQLKLTLTANPN